MDDESPFSDPAILQHQSPGGYMSPNATGGGASNPFSSFVVGNNDPSAQYVLPSQQQATTPAAAIPPSTRNATASSQDGFGTPPPPYSMNSKPMTSEELLKQQEMLEKKAAELDRKEREISQREAAAGIRPNNFPPLPSFVPFKPCFYQDFDVDIAIEFRETVKRIYYSYLFFVLVIFFNVFACIVNIACDGKDSGAHMVFGVLIFVLGTPCGYVCWMRAVYNAFKNDSSFNFFLFFFSFFLKICILIFYTIGIPGYGACGWIVTFELFNADQYFGGVVCFITAASLTALAVIMAILLQKVHAFYRHSGASFEKAQVEFSSGFMSNSHVQSAAANVARGAARSATSSQNP